MRTAAELLKKIKDEKEGRINYLWHELERIVENCYNSSPVRTATTLELNISEEEEKNLNCKLKDYGWILVPSASGEYCVLCMIENAGDENN